jgi:hypothetical protein
MKTESKKLENGDLQITLTFDEHDQICLNDDLLDIVKWYSEGPSAEKIYRCEERMMLKNKEKFLSSPLMADKKMSEINAIISNKVLLCKEISMMPGYKNRHQREEELI